MDKQSNFRTIKATMTERHQLKGNMVSENERGTGADAAHL
jgi:hypothetical protein